MRLVIDPETQTHLMGLPAWVRDDQRHALRGGAYRLSDERTMEKIISDPLDDDVSGST